VAVADPGSSGSAANSTATNQQPSTGAKNPKKDGTDTKDEKKDSGLAAAAPNAVAPAPTAVAPAPAAVAPAPAAVAPAPNAVAPAPNAVAPAPAAVAPAPAAVAPAPAAVAPVPAAVAPAPNAAAPVPNLVGPVSDVIALIQDMLTSVDGAVVAVTQLQSELAFFLFGITGVEPVVDAWGRIASDALSASVHAWVASELPRLRAFAGIPRMPVADIATAVAPRGGLAASIFAAMTQVGGASSLPGLAQSFFRPAS